MVYLAAFIYLRYKFKNIHCLLVEVHNMFVLIARFGLNMVVFSLLVLVAFGEESK